jgi:hypothetical protein
MSSRLAFAGCAGEKMIEAPMVVLDCDIGLEETIDR